ncbi:formyl-CoA transferase [Halobacteriales archaeon QS_5_70_15]|nr:MAG: formyl-CoA transferase [Halobacteriales archaeon QS_5_70_15]
MARPLEDVSVLELSTMIAGPYAGQMLGDLGADVVKIERPGGGELARGLEPMVDGESFYYLTANRNKRGLALDVTDEDGREVFLDLAEAADVVLLNFPPTFAERYGIDHETVRERNPELVYCSISAYGATGPYREDAGIDTTVQALSGAMSMARTEETPPMRTGVPMNDVFASLYAVQGILTALYDRRDTGEGEFVDVALLDAGVAGLTTRATYSFATGEPYPPFGRRHNYFAPEGVYEVADGDVQLSVITDRHWRRFCEAIDEPGLAADERFEEVNRRVSNRGALDDRLADLLAGWEVDELVAALREHDVPAAPVNDTVSVWEHPQVRARGMRRTMEHPDAGEVDTLGFPVKYDRIEPRIDRHPPRPGEHTEAVLRARGYSDPEIDELREAGLIETAE